MSDLEDIIKCVDDDNHERFLCISYVKDRLNTAPAYQKELIFFHDYEEKEMYYHWFLFDYSVDSIVAMGPNFHDVLSDADEYNEEDFCMVDDNCACAMNTLRKYIDSNHINDAKKVTINSKKKINNSRYKRV